MPASRLACLRRAGRLAFAEPAGLPSQSRPACLCRADRLAFAEPAGLPSQLFWRYFDFFKDVYEEGLLPYWREGMYDQLLWRISESLWNIFNMVNKSVNYWTYQLYYFAFADLKLTKCKIDAFLLENLTMAHWIRLSRLCRCKWTRKSQVSYEMFQSNKYFLWA